MTVNKYLRQVLFNIISGINLLANCIWIILLAIFAVNTIKDNSFDFECYTIRFWIPFVISLLLITIIPNEKFLKENLLGEKNNVCK